MGREATGNPCLPIERGGDIPSVPLTPVCARDERMKHSLIVTVAIQYGLREMRDYDFPKFIFERKR
jgi:hypothetical protein